MAEESLPVAAVDSVSKIPADHLTADLFYLQATEEYQAFHPAEKAIAAWKIAFPEVGPGELALKAGVQRQTVWKFLSSPEWRVCEKKIARQQMSDLTPLAIKTLKTVMSKGSDKVKLDASCRILINEGLLAAPYGTKIQKQDNKIVVVWGSGETIGNSNPVCAALEAAGNTPKPS